MDAITILSVIIISMFVGIGAFLIGRWMDLNWRQKMIRMMTKKDLGLLAIMDRDKKRTIYKPVDFQNCTIIVGDNMWVFNKRHLFRQDKIDAKAGTYDVSANLKGFKIKEEMIKWEEGCPVLYVDKDSIKPVIFDSNDDPVKPMEIYAGLKTWIDNERAKLMATANILKTIQLLLIVAIAFGLISAGISWQTKEELTKFENTTYGFMTYMGYNATPVTQKGK